MKCHHLFRIKLIKSRDILSIGVVAALLGGLLAAAPASLAQTTWYVDDDAPGDPGSGDPSVSDPLEDGSPEHPFDAIQEGINTAVDGDEVIVLDGRYTGIGNKNLDFNGRIITLRSQSGPENCIIDPERDGRGFYFHTSETPLAVVYGFTITNGTPVEGDGGGILCLSASPSVVNCIITGNTADDGGGICWRWGAPTIISCTLTRNVTGSGSGGGLYIRSCSRATSIIGCTITDNLTGDFGDGGGGIYAASNEGLVSIQDCVITGNTLRNGNGAGIYLVGGGTAITNCTIARNVVTDQGFGAGLYCRDTQYALIDACTISENVVRGDGSGAGVFVDGGSSELNNCTISGNLLTEEGYGGGVFLARTNETEISGCRIHENIIDGEGGGGGIGVVGGAPTIDSCTITRNVITGSGEGGGIHLQEPGDYTIRRCTVTENEASAGGGVYCLRLDEVTIDSCTIARNVTNGAGGGGVWCAESDLTFSNCRFVENNASGTDATGGAVDCHGSNAVLTNCTVLGNSASSGGGGAYGEDGYLTITNSILWGNSPDGLLSIGGEASVTYSDIQGGWPGEGNIDFDPGVAFNHDPRLMPFSVCIDAGTNDPPGGLPLTDHDGGPRVLDGDGDATAIVDMGAHESTYGSPAIACSPPVVIAVAYIDGPVQEQNISIRNSGSGVLDWEIAEHCPWLDVEPADGQSSGAINDVILRFDASGLSVGLHAASFEIIAPVAVNSPRTVEVQLRVWSGFPTIQSLIDAAADGDTVLVHDGRYIGPGNRDLDFGGKRIALRSENGPESCVIDCLEYGRGFIFQSGEIADAIVGGFTITNGFAPYVGGGAILCVNAGPTITNCNIAGNTTDWHGGGICSLGGLGPVVNNCTIAGNRAQRRGGGVYCEGDYGANPPAISNCTIAGNNAYRGGGVCSMWAESTITNCNIAWNVARGGMGGGGGVDCDYGSSSTIANCTIVENSGPLGGGLRCRARSSLLVENGIVWANAQPVNRIGGGAQMAVVDAGTTLAVSFSDVEGGADAVYVDDASSLLWGSGNIDIDPFFVSPDGPDGDPNDWTDNDYRLAAGSPCIDAGCNCAVPPDELDLDGDGDTDEFTPLDLDGEGRFFDDPDTDDTGSGLQPIVDIGAYEYGGGDPAPCRGDLDGDRDVDLADLAILLAHYRMTGVTGTDGDMDCDGDVELSDLAVFLSRYGSSCE